MSGPKLIICSGLQRSGSTWLFNAVQDLLALEGPVRSSYRDFIDAGIEAEYAADAHNIIKCHQPDGALRRLITLFDLPVFLTIRDPRDCVASLLSQFHYDFDFALHTIVSSAHETLALLEVCTPLILRYEARGARSLQTLSTIAKCLGVSAGRDRLREIHTRLSTRAVKQFIGNLETSGVFDHRPPALQVHPATQWHPNHIGSGRVGKHARELTPEQSAKVLYCTRAFSARFGYLPTLPPIEPGVSLALGGVDCLHARHGFSFPEGWGIWTDSAMAEIELPTSAPIDAFTIRLDCILSSTLTSGLCGPLHVSVNDERILTLPPATLSDETQSLVLEGNARGAQCLRIRFDLPEIQSAEALGIGCDYRSLGVGLRRIDVNYAPM